MKSNDIAACICEGTAEKVIITKLLSDGKLIFDRNSLFYEDILKCRSARKFEDTYLQKASPPIILYRILDSRSEQFPMREAYKKRVKKIINIITAPEIEILIIINEGKYDDYQKCKRQKHNRDMKPSQYCKGELGFKEVKSKSFLEKYFNDSDILVELIKEYKRKCNVPKGEKCLCDLLK